MSAIVTTIRDRFSSEATNWDRLYSEPGHGQQSIYEHNVWMRRQTALAYLGSPEGRVLDIGCGPGNVALEIDTSKRVIATDFALPMLRTAQASARKRNGTLDLIASDATALPFSGESVESIIVLGLLEYITQPSDLLDEIHRVLEPGGTFVLSSPNARSHFIIIDDALKNLKNLFTQDLLPSGLRKRLKSLMGKTDEPYFTHKRHRFSPAEIRHQLIELGFEITDTTFHTFGFGVLNRVRLNLSLCRKLESWAPAHPNLEKLGWTIVLKAKKLS